MVIASESFRRCTKSFSEIKEEKKTMSKLLNTIIAAAAGFAAGILLAPKSGKETREELRAKALETKERVDEKAEEAAEMLKEGAAKAEVEARGMAESVKKSAGTVAAEANYLGHEAKERVGRVVEKTKPAASAKSAVKKD
jgi:gas vesicle protein